MLRTLPFHLFPVGSLDCVSIIIRLLYLTLSLCVTCYMYVYTGDLPYSELGNTVILSRVMAGYRLECPEGCPDRL